MGPRTPIKPYYDIFKLEVSLKRKMIFLDKKILIINYHDYH